MQRDAGNPPVPAQSHALLIIQPEKKFSSRILFAGLAKTRVPQGDDLILANKAAPSDDAIRGYTAASTAIQPHHECARVVNPGLMQAERGKYVARTRILVSTLR